MQIFLVDTRSDWAMIVSEVEQSGWMWTNPTEIQGKNTSESAFCPTFLSLPGSWGTCLANGNAALEPGFRT
jgi:hypothetical protein